MKVFAIRDEEDMFRKNLAYLIYYERKKQFFIELPDDADEWETPLLLSSFVKRGIKTVGAYWSRLWVQQRIVPTDRQNLGQILKANGLTEYDEYRLLMLADGRCAQDSYYLAPIEQELFFQIFRERYEKKVEDVVPLRDRRFLAFLHDGTVKKCDLNVLVQDDRTFAPVSQDEAKFRMVTVETGGHGVCWGERLIIAAQLLAEKGVDIPLSPEDFTSFASGQLISTAQAADMLGCSRQNINDLVARGKLHPVKAEQKTTFFLKGEVARRLWK